MLKLTDKWIPILTNQPETGMDYQVVTVILNDGRHFKQSIHQAGYITQVRGYTEIPFSEKEIKDIVVSHDKWNFNKERQN